MARRTIMRVCAVAFSLCILAGVADAAKSGTVASGNGGSSTITSSPPPPPAVAAAAKAPAPSPPPPAAAATTSTAASSGSAAFDPLVSPFGDKCTFATTNSPITVNGYPSSPFSTKPFVFVNKFKPLTEKKSGLSTKTGAAPCRADGVCIDGYSLTIEEFMSDVTGILPGTPCKQVPLLGYDGMSPGPLIIGRTGVQDVTRFTNKISPQSKFFPPAGPGDTGGEGERDLCANRANRYQQRDINGTSLVKPGVGRATVTHHHGMASTSSMDGWAEQFFCYGESKDYVLPNNRAAGLYYHDHAVGITSANTYGGLTGMRLTRPCPNASGESHDPYNVEADASAGPAVPEHHLVLQDFVLEKPRAGEDGICRRRYDRQGAHQDQLWGDINVVNGVPWPVLDITSTWRRFRVLNASPSRPFNLQFRDEAGKEIGSDKCYLIGSDGGIIPNADQHRLPKTGLLTDVAYRWDIICDFSGYTKPTAIYLFNVHDAGKTTSETPFFCYSHLIMKFNVAPATAADAAIRTPNPSGSAQLEQNAALPPALLRDLTARAMRGDQDRTLKFGRGAGMWVFNGRGWDHNDNLGKGKHIEFDDVGQNTVELWTLESGGGWIHPIHIHLVDFFCLAWQGADWDANTAGTGGWQPCPKELINAPKDVLHIGANVGRITLAARYGPHLGEYMMHCHNGVHEDNDMFRAFMISDASKGLTFSTVPNHWKDLAKSPLSKSDEYGDTRNTTWGTENGVAPAFTNAYARTLLERDYYHVFYPRSGSTLDDQSANIYLTTCGRGQYNADDDPPLPQCDPDADSKCKDAIARGEAQPIQVVGRRLLRSKHNW